MSSRPIDPSTRMSAVARITKENAKRRREERRERPGKGDAKQGRDRPPVSGETDHCVGVATLCNVSEGAEPWNGPLDCDAHASAQIDSRPIDPSTRMSAVARITKENAKRRREERRERPEKGGAIGPPELVPVPSGATETTTESDAPRVTFDSNTRMSAVARITKGAMKRNGRTTGDIEQGRGRPPVSGGSMDHVEDAALDNVGEGAAAVNGPLDCDAQASAPIDGRLINPSTRMSAVARITKENAQQRREERRARPERDGASGPPVPGAMEQGHIHLPVSGETGDRDEDATLDDDALVNQRETVLDARIDEVSEPVNGPPDHGVPPAAHEAASVDNRPIEAFTASAAQHDWDETIRRHVLGKAVHISSRAVKAIDNDDDFVENEGQATNECCFQKRHQRLVCSIALILVCFVAGGVIFGVIYGISSSGSDDERVEAGGTFTTIPSVTPSLVPSAYLSLPTSSPSLFPTSVRFELLKASLESTSSEADLSNWQSPQYRALSWLADEDDMNISVHDEVKLIQRYIAAIFFFSSVESANFTLSDIMVGDECTWNRMPSAFSFGAPGGIVCSEAGKVASINFGLHFRPLVGSFPEEIGYLDQLQNLTIFNNPGLTGTIPGSIVLIQELARVQFLDNGEVFGGTIPPFSSQSIRAIAIGEPSCYGTIPSSIGNLTELVSLTLQCDLSGTIPEAFADMEKLNVLSIHETRLVGSIPSLLGQKQDLFIVSFGNSMGNGMLNGTIPSGLVRSKNLRALFLHGNRISGTIGSEFGLLTDLMALSLHSNMLSSGIPAELGNTGSLEYLELGDNLLNGAVPQTLANLVNLQSLSLAGNSDLSGDVNFLCNMSIANLLTDCNEGNPDLECFCCDCCHGSSRTCARYPVGIALYQDVVNSECCLKPCGKFDCTGNTAAY